MAPATPDEWQGDFNRFIHDRYLSSRPSVPVQQREQQQREQQQREQQQRELQQQQQREQQQRLQQQQREQQQREQQREQQQREQVQREQQQLREQQQRQQLLLQQQQEQQRRAEQQREQERERLEQQAQMQREQERERLEQQRLEEAQRVAEAKVALLRGYEGGFPQADGVKKDTKTLDAAVVSAQHVPVPLAKVQAGKDAVLLLIDGRPVQSLQRSPLVYWPVQLIGGAAADSFEVVMEAPTLLYRTDAEARARKEQQIGDAWKRIVDAQSTLTELQEALGRNQTALEQAAQAPDGHAELSDIGAMAVEQQRIRAEIARQQAIEQTQARRLAEQQNLTDDQLQLTEHRITPCFTLPSGYHILPAAAAAAVPGVAPGVRIPRAAQAEKVLQVVRRSKPISQVEVRFSYAVTE